MSRGLPIHLVLLLLFLTRTTSAYELGLDPANETSIRLLLVALDGQTGKTVFELEPGLVQSGGTAFIEARAEGVLDLRWYVESFGFSFGPLLLSGSISTVTGPREVALNLTSASYRFSALGSALNESGVPLGGGGTLDADGQTTLFAFFSGTLTEGGISAPFSFAINASPTPCLQQGSGSGALFVDSADSITIGAQWNRGPMLECSGTNHPLEHTLGTINGLTYRLEAKYVINNFRTNTAYARPGPTIDSDGDGVPDSADNCPEIASLDFSDADQDSVGSLCDSCPLTVNTDQLDSDADGIGDACQPGDFNRDGILDLVDSVLVRRVLAGEPIP